MRIALCVIATGKYLEFVPPLMAGMTAHFLPGHVVMPFIFSDHKPSQWPIYSVPHEPWPGPTLHRYHHMLTAEKELSGFDYVFYIDADMLIVDTVGDEILGELVATIHPGFAGKHRGVFTYEKRRESAAYVAPNEGRFYLAGGFQGGEAPTFISAMKTMRDAIDEDKRNGITAIWNDESHWQRFCIDHPPTVILPPIYCCPETWTMDGRKILALDKDHAAMRS